MIKAKDCSIWTSFRVRLRAGSKAVDEETNKLDFRKKVKNATRAAVKKTRSRDCWKFMVDRKRSRIWGVIGSLVEGE